MMRALFNLIFGCRHRALSWPLTMRQPRKRTYVVCLRCGSEFDYDFETMQISQIETDPCPIRGAAQVRELTGHEPCGFKVDAVRRGRRICRHAREKRSF